MSERIPLIAGNWKMNLVGKEAVSLAESLVKGIEGLEGRQVLIAPPYTVLNIVKETIGTSAIFLAAQNMHWEDKGAFTGEISGHMLLDVGCTHVILGHSERRQLFSETDEVINLKVQKAVDLGLCPILCIGETLEEREQGNTFKVLKAQLEGSLNYFVSKNELPTSLILAYEPVWAIGTGKTATPEQAQEVHEFIRKWARETFGATQAEQLRILYGGSVKPDNAASLMSQPDIDGALVGGASLKAESFLKIIHY